jgi:hypothetical protein
MTSHSAARPCYAELGVPGGEIGKAGDAAPARLCSSFMEEHPAGSPTLSETRQAAGDCVWPSTLAVPFGVLGRRGFEHPARSTYRER